MRRVLNHPYFIAKYLQRYCETFCSRQCRSCHQHHVVVWCASLGDHGHICTSKRSLCEHSFHVPLDMHLLLKLIVHGAGSSITCTWTRPRTRPWPDDQSQLGSIHVKSATKEETINRHTSRNVKIGKPMACPQMVNALGTHKHHHSYRCPEPVTENLQHLTREIFMK